MVPPPEMFLVSVLYWVHDIPWNQGAEEQNAFQKLKDLHCTDTILVHFNPSLPNGISCVGFGCCFLPWLQGDGIGCPISNASKTFNNSQQGYSQDSEGGTDHSYLPSPPVLLQLYIHSGHRTEATRSLPYQSYSCSCS